RLQRYEWPGNVRELQNVIERAVILSKGERLRLDLALSGVPAAMASLLPPSSNDTDGPILTEREWRDRERTNLLNALRRAEGRIYGPEGAAELLGLKPTTLTSRLRALKIEIPSP